LRNIIGGMDLERTLTSREEINAALRGVLDEATGKWGIRVNRVELKAIEPPTSIQESAEKQMRADRDKRAAILQAEGEKQAALLKAETEREVAAILARGSEATRNTPQSPVRASPVPGHQSLRQDDPRRIGRYHLTALPWLATAYIPGPSLHDVLRQQGALPTRTLLTLAVGIAEALEGIHACGIIHRDLKPSNIIVSSAGPRVIDFGIARALDSTTLTRTNHVVGTQGFLAPEQLTGTSVTPAADLYAFGMVLCHAAGVTPLTDGESLESALSLLPARFVGIITRRLGHNPNGRPKHPPRYSSGSPRTTPQPKTGCRLPYARWSTCTTPPPPRRLEPIMRVTSAGSESGARPLSGRVMQPPGSDCSAAMRSPW
ncbi:protein kinase, partial [Streptomyces sp. NPDC059679]|uniref:protein kinase domain-containing protein n=1 Tax=Streptomyces sp. NPDC059679 TaxID=3346903 RepID=UPI00368C2EA2